jgi:conjugal transfer pilus assembly protein TraF
MIKTRFLTLSFLAFILFSAAAQAADNNSFYGGREGKGYYQYVKPNPSQDNTTAVAAEEKVEGYKRPFVPTDEVLYKMPAEEFQKLYTATLNYALTERNLDTYTDYARLIHMVNIRAREFASLQVLYAQLHPRENENRFRGSATRIQLNKEKKKTLESYKDSYSLIYFYSPYCPYCQRFAPLLNSFIKQYDWQVEYIDISSEPEMAAAFGVTVTPTVKLVTPKEDILSINNGMVNLEDFENRIYRYIRYIEGITDDTSFIDLM